MSDLALVGNQVRYEQKSYWRNPGAAFFTFAFPLVFFFILVNDGTDPVTDTFNGLPEGSTVNFSGKTFQIFYGANSETGTQTGGNDVLIVVPEPTAAVSLLMALGSVMGLSRLRRRNA